MPERKSPALGGAFRERQPSVARLYIARKARSYSMSRKERSCSERLGWRSLRNAFASIWRMRSRVTSNCLPTSSSVWSVFMRSEEHTSELQSLMRISYAVFCLKKKKKQITTKQKRYRKTHEYKTQRGITNQKSKYSKLTTKRD